MIFFVVVSSNTFVNHWFPLSSHKVALKFEKKTPQKTKSPYSTLPIHHHIQLLYMSVFQLCCNYSDRICVKKCVACSCHGQKFSRLFLLSFLVLPAVIYVKKNIHVHNHLYNVSRTKSKLLGAPELRAGAPAT